MLDLVGNSEWFDEGHASPGCATVCEDGHELREREGMRTASEVDKWVQREWMDVSPGGEAVVVRDLAGEFEGGKDSWLSVASLEGDCG